MNDDETRKEQSAGTLRDAGDWIGPRIEGMAYLEKPPLKYWLIAISYTIFGVHDWSARIPIALSALLLCWMTAQFGAWAFGAPVGIYAGLCLATCAGLFLFTRVLISDVMLTLAITLAIWSLVRALDEAEPHPSLWAVLMWASLGTGLLIKGLIPIGFPVPVLLLFLLFERRLFDRKVWGRLQPLAGLVVF